MNSNQDVIQRWPNLTRESANSQKGPCPFCPPDHTTIYNDDGVGFSGTDRFFLKRTGGGCRECGRNGRGSGVRGWHSLKEIYIRLGLAVPEGVTKLKFEGPEDNPLRGLWFDAQVDAAHEHVDHKFWWFWSKEIIEQFRLGYADIKWSQMTNAHLIPTQATHYTDGTLEGWYISARDGSGRKIRPHYGSSKHHYWSVETDPEDKTIFIGEGEKEPITAIALGYRNAVCTYSSENISKGLMVALWSKGYRHLVFGGDHDSAGREFNDKLTKWARELRFHSAQRINWPDALQPGHDTTDTLKACEGDVVKARALIDSYLVDVSLQIEQATSLDADDITIVTIQELRGEGPDGLKGRMVEFLETYEPNTIQVIGPEPGAGKTYTALRLVEERARMWLKKKGIAKENLKEEILDLETQLLTAEGKEEIDNLKRTLQSKKRSLQYWSNLAIGWFAQYVGQWDDLVALGADLSLWYNFEARNLDNCANFPLVTRLGQNNHDIGGFCNSGCPFADACRKRGYLKQEEDIRDKVIGFFRHQQLFTEYASSVMEVWIDENPAPMWTVPMIINARDLYPFDRDREIEEEFEWEQLKRLMTAVRAAMSTNAGAERKNTISGAAFMTLIDQQLVGTTLAEIIDDITSAATDAYHPSFHGGNNDNPDIKLRCVKEFLKVLRRELPDYIENPNNRYVSCLHLICGQLEINGTLAISIPAKVPVILMDGTTLPEIVEIAFGREALVFRPEFRNANCVTTVIKNSDWTKGDLNRQVGNRAVQLRNRPKTIAGFDVETLPGTDHISDSRYVNEAITLINGLAEKHEKLLVVMYQLLQEILEKQIYDTHPHLRPKIAMAHYGATRGTNKYADWPAVLLIGAYRIPYDVLYRQICMWAVLSGKKMVIENVLVDKELAYDGVDEKALYKTFEHAFADRIVRHFEESELRQAAGRIRAHSSDAQKWIYTAFERPALRAVTQIVRKVEFLDQFRPSKRALLRKLMIEGAETNYRFKGVWKYPAQKDLTEAVGCSNRDIQAMKKQLALEGFDKPPATGV